MKNERKLIKAYQKLEEDRKNAKTLRLFQNIGNGVRITEGSGNKIEVINDCEFIGYEFNGNYPKAIFKVNESYMAKYEE